MYFKTEDLGGVTVFCDKTHKFGTDAIELARFAAVKKVKNVCDMGTGCGIIALELLRLFPDAAATAVDIQPSAIALVEKARIANGFQHRLQPICADIRSLDTKLTSKFDLVTMNPPYKKAGAGIMSENESVNIARFELKCTIDDCCKAAAKLLNAAGRFCLCHRPQRLCDIICSMRAAGIEPKLLQTVCQRKGAPPSLILVSGTKNAAPALKLLPTKYIEQ